MTNVVPVPITVTPVVGADLSYHPNYNPITYAGIIWLFSMSTLLFAALTYIVIMCYDKKNRELLPSNGAEMQPLLQSKSANSKASDTEKYSSAPANKAKPAKINDQKIPLIPEVKNGMSINDMIKEINEIITAWSKIYQPITSGRAKTLKKCNMENKSGASIKDAVMGLLVTIVVDLNYTFNDLKNAITFTKQSPYLDFSLEDKYQAVGKSIKEWAMGYADVKDHCQELIDKLEELPQKAKEIESKAKGELENSGLDPFTLIKVLKDTLSSASKIPKVCKTLKSQIESVPVELKELIDACEKLPNMIRSGDIIKKGEACKKAIDNGQNIQNDKDYKKAIKNGTIVQKGKDYKTAVQNGAIVEKGNTTEKSKLQNILLCYENAYGKIKD